MKKMIVVFVVFMGFVGMAGASVVYDESVNGDLSDSPATLINLSLGTNTILGSSIFATGVRDLDSFLFQISAGQHAVSGIFEVLNRSLSGNTTLLRSHYDLYDSGLNLLGGYNANIRLDGEQSIFGALDGGVYGANNASFTRSGSGGSWDYAITITVEEVPEPESLTLASLGLLILAAGGLRRRKQS